MSRITPYLYLGGAQEARNINFLLNKRVHTIVNCARDLPDMFAGQNIANRTFHYIRLELDDTTQQSLAHILDPIADVIIQLMREGKVVFVHCIAGISRSASIVIYTLMKLHKWNYEKAFHFVQSLHPRTDPNPGFVQQLVQRNKPMQREGTPLYVQNIPQPSPQNIETTIDFVDGPGGLPGIGPPSAFVQNVGHGIRGEGYHPRDDIYDTPGGMKPIEDPTQPGTKKGWTQLTFDCPECELPEYSAGGGRGLYARIFN